VSFSVLDSFGGHSFSHSMNTHESNMRFHLLMDSLTPFSSGLGQVHGHAFRASFVAPRLILVLLPLVHLMLFPLEILVIFLMIVSSFSSS
jgi:hypothetical protein